MNNPAIRKLEKNDAEICRAFKNLILQGSFQIQGSAAIQAGSLFNWFSNLDKRIEETLKIEFPKLPEIKPIEEKKAKK